MTENESPKSTVSVAPEVLPLLVGHASSHSTTAIHGALIGQVSQGKVTITDAFPICHENPTKVLVETSLSLVQSSLDDSTNKSEKSVIVGWYTAPELLQPGEKVKPSPVALRIVASLASKDLPNPVLLVLDNDAVVKAIEGTEQSPESLVSAFGKDFGNQWMEPLELQVTDAAKAMKAICKQIVEVNDLTDHWKAGAVSEWTTAQKLQKVF
jgi:proteasome lid subunit RPN8/RPN11